MNETVDAKSVPKKVERSRPPSERTIPIPEEHLKGYMMLNQQAANIGMQVAVLTLQLSELQKQRDATLEMFRQANQQLTDAAQKIGENVGVRGRAGVEWRLDLQRRVIVAASPDYPLVQRQSASPVGKSISEGAESGEGDSGDE